MCRGILLALLIKQSPTHPGMYKAQCCVKKPTNLKNREEPIVIEQSADDRVIDMTGLSQTLDLIQTVYYLVHRSCEHAPHQSINQSIKSRNSAD